MLERFPPLGQQREAALAQAAHRAQKRVTCPGINVQLFGPGRLLYRDVDAMTCAFVAGIGQDGHGIQERPQYCEDILAGGGQVMDIARQHIRDGCGSTGVSWLRCEDEVIAVFDVVDALVLWASVVAPVGVEVAVGDQGAELEYGLGAFEAPPRARYVHSVLYQIPAGALDYAGGDGPAPGQRGGVVQVVLLVLQVAGAFVGARALGAGVAVGGGAAADPGRDLGGVAVQDLAGLGGDPFLGGGLALVEKRPGGLPAVFQDVDEVDDDRDGDAAAGGLGGYGLDLGVVPVDQDDPFPLVTGVAALGLIERGGDDGGDVVGDRGGQPLVPGLRFPRLSPLLPLAGLRFLLLLLPFLRGGADDLVRGPRGRGGVVDAGDLAHPLAAVLLPGRQPGGEPALRGCRGLRGRRAQRPRQHDDALAVEGQDQRPALWRRLHDPLQVKGLHMRGSPAAHVLQLPFPYPHAGRAGDRSLRVLHRAARRGFAVSVRA